MKRISAKEVIFFPSWYPIITFAIFKKACYHRNKETSEIGRLLKLLKRLLQEIENMDKKIVRWISRGIAISFAISLLGVLLLVGYHTYPLPYDVYQGGFLLVKAGFSMAAQSFCCGFLVDKTKLKIT